MKEHSQTSLQGAARQTLSGLTTALLLLLAPAALMASAPPATLSITHSGTNAEGQQTFLLEWNAASNATYKVQSGNFGDTAGLNGNDMVWKTIDVVTATSNAAQFKIQGRSIPENSVEFFQLLMPETEIFSVEPAVFPPGVTVVLYVTGQCFANTDVVHVNGMLLPGITFVDHTRLILPGQVLSAGTHTIAIVRSGQVVASTAVVCADAATSPELVLQEPPGGFPPASPIKAVVPQKLPLGGKKYKGNMNSAQSNPLYSDSGRITPGGDIRENDNVVFEVQEGKKGLNAVNVKLARMAGGGGGGLNDNSSMNDWPGLFELVPFSAELQHQVVDMFIPSRGIDFIFARTYRSRTGTNTTMGQGWTHSYNIHVQPLGGDLLIHDGTGRSDLFRLQTNGTWTADGFFYEVTSNNNRVKVKFPWLGAWEFNALDGSPGAGKIASSMDAHGNTMTFAYDGMGRLTQIVDTLGRTNILAYDADGRVATLTDFTGRTVTYQFHGGGGGGGSAGDLIRVITPPVMDTPNSNDFPGGKTNTYAYSTGFADARLNHNLLAVTDPKGQTWLQVVYRTNLISTDGNFDSVDYVQRGAYRTHLRRNAQTPAPSNQFAVVKAILKDGAGNVTECFFDARNRCVRQLDYTGRAVPDLATTQIANRPMNKLRPDDPEFFETRWSWNNDHLCTSVTLPRSNSVQCIYERDFDPGASPIKKGDLRVRRELPCCGGGTDSDGDGTLDLTERVWRYEYDLRFGSNEEALRAGFRKFTKGLERLREARLAALYPDSQVRHSRRLGYEPDPGLSCSAEIRQNIEELHAGVSAGGSGSSAWIGLIEGFVVSATDPRGNKSTASYDAQGNCVRVTDPFIVGNDPPVVDFAYNAFGQVTSITNAPDGNGRRSVDTFEYHESGTQMGYLHHSTRDNFLQGAADVIQGLRTSYEYDPHGNVTRIIDPRTNDWLFTYNTIDQCMVRQLPLLGSISVGFHRIATDYFYDANDNLVQVDQENRDHTGALDPANPQWTTSYEYDALNRTTLIGHELTHVVQQRTRYFYDANDNVTAVESPEAVNGHDANAMVSFEYDERDLLFRALAAPGSGMPLTNEWSYDGNRNVIGHHQNAQFNALYSHDAFDRLGSVTDSMGNVSEFAYDANNNVKLFRILAETNDVPGSAGNLRYHEWRWNYDSLDRRISSHGAFFDPATQAALGDGECTHTCSYAPNGLLLSETDDNGNTTHYAYDTAHRLNSITDAKSNIVALARDRCGNIITVTSTERPDVGGPDHVFVESFSYDGLNRLVNRSDNLGNNQNWFFDSRDSLVRVLDANTNLTGYLYDGVSRVTEIWRDRNRDGERDESDAYTHYTWDDNDRLTAVSDSNTNTTLYVYDSRDRLVSTTNPDGTMESLIWSPRSNLASRTDPNGTLVTNIYDLNDRLVSRQVVPGMGVAMTTTFETNAYDGAGRLVMASNDVSRVEAAYDSLGNRTRIIADGWQMLAAFDANGNRTTLTYPDEGVAVYGYDSLDRVSSVAFSTGGGAPPSSMATLSYEGPSRLSRIARANGINTRINWNGLQNAANSAGDLGWRQVSRVNHQVSGGGAVIDQRMAAYDRNQNRTLRAQTAPFHPGGDNTTNLWAYDTFDRLTQSARVKGSTVDYSRSYVLDARGNRIATTNDGVPMIYIRANTLPEPADFQMDQYTFTPFGMHQYDRNGNLVSTLPPTPGSVPLHYAYDYANQLVEVTRETAPGIFEPVASYGYDALGQRISKTVYPGVPVLPVTTHYIHGDEGDGILQTRTGALIDSCVHLNEDRGLLGLRRSGGEVLYYHTDDLGNVLALTDAGGNVVERYGYDDYGAPEFLNSDGVPLVDTLGQAIASSPAGNPFLFQGMEWDGETGLYCTGIEGSPKTPSSYMDPETGQFTSRRGASTRDPDGLVFNVVNPRAARSNNPWSLKKEEGGRHTPFHNKYRPQFYLRTTDVTGEIELESGRAMEHGSFGDGYPYTGRRRVEVLKSNKQGDPDANRTLHDSSGGGRGWFLDDIEVVLEPQGIRLKMLTSAREATTKANNVSQLFKPKKKPTPVIKSHELTGHVTLIK